MGIVWKSVKAEDYFIWGIGAILTSFSGVVVAQIIKSAGEFTLAAQKIAIGKFVLISLVEWGMVYLGNYIVMTKRADIIKKLNVFIKEKVTRVAACSVETESATIISFVTNDLKLLEDNYLKIMFDIFENLGILIVSIIYMVSINPIIATIYISMSFLMLIPEKIYKRKLENSGVKFSIQKARYLDFLKDFLFGKDTLQGNQVLNIVDHQLETKLVASEDAQYQMIKLTNKLQLLSFLISGLNFILPFGIGLLIIMQTNIITIPSLIAIFLASNQVFSPFVTILNYRNQLTTTKDIREKLSQFLEKDTDRTILEKSKRTNNTVVQQLVIDHVTKKYGNKTVLNNVSLKVKKEYKTLIIGKSGAGKTTIFQILLGNVLPDSGRVYVLNEENLELPFSRSMCGIIHQQPYIFNQTIRYNLSFGEKISDEMLLDVLELVGLKEELGDDPLEYQAGEEGSNLSGGQIVRIEIARNILRKKEILLVDEVTASLDENNSQLIRDILYRLDCIIIEIAHHFSREKEHAAFDCYELSEGELSLAFKGKKYE